VIIGSSSHFEIAIATAISLYGLVTGCFGDYDGTFLGGPNNARFGLSW